MRVSTTHSSPRHPPSTLEGPRPVSPASSCRHDRKVGVRRLRRLDPTTPPQFAGDLPIRRDRRDQWRHVEMEIRRTNQNLGLVNPGGGHRNTLVYGYGLKGGRVTYLGPTFVAKSGQDVDVR